MADNTTAARADTGARDILCGLSLTVIGAAIAAYCWVHYPVGTLRQLGSGGFPMGLGVVLAGFGVMITIEGLTTRARAAAPAEAPLVFPVRAVLVTALALGLFTLLIERTGILPATLVMIVTADFAAGRPAPAKAAAIGVAMAALGYAVFVLALGITMPFLRWPL